MPWARRFVAGCTIALVAGCASEWDPLGVSHGALAVEGPWQIPAHVLTAGDGQYVAYEGAGPWLGEAYCAGELEPGSRLVGDALALHFPQVALIGGYNCRPIRGTTETMSLHGAGRAVDVHITTLGSAADADNEAGDPIGEFLIEHAELLGIQLVIWDQWSWGASRAEGAKGRTYTGVNPHHDHLHVELSVEAAQRDSDWFSAQLWPADAGVYDAGASDAGAPSDAGSGDGGTAPEPGTPPEPPERPVINPILDDDPMGVGAEVESGGDGGPSVIARSATPVRGETCTLSPGRSGSPWLLLALGLWLGSRRRTRDVRRSG